jgi:hypothetical protein
MQGTSPELLTFPLLSPNIHLNISPSSMDRHRLHLYKHGPKFRGNGIHSLLFVMNARWLSMYMYVLHIMFTLGRSVRMLLLQMGLASSDQVPVMVETVCLFYMGKFGSSALLILMLSSS